MQKKTFSGFSMSDYTFWLQNIFVTKKSFLFTFHNFLRILWKKCYCRVRSWVRDKPGNNAMKTSSLLRLDAICHSNITWHFFALFWPSVHPCAMWHFFYRLRLYFTFKLSKIRVKKEEKMSHDTFTTPPPPLSVTYYLNGP